MPQITQQASTPLSGGLAMDRLIPVAALGANIHNSVLVIAHPQCNQAVQQSGLVLAPAANSELVPASAGSRFYIYNIKIRGNAVTTLQMFNGANAWWFWTPQVNVEEVWEFPLGGFMLPNLGQNISISNVGGAAITLDLLMYIGSSNI